MIIKKSRIKGRENIMRKGKEPLTLKDVLTEEEKEIVEEYRELMETTWSRRKADNYYKTIMEILNEAEERY